MIAVSCWWLVVGKGLRDTGTVLLYLRGKTGAAGRDGSGACRCL